MTSAKSAVLLLAHGTPDKPEDIPAYLRNITGGRPLPDAVMEEIQHRYNLIGRSPLTDITLQQADALSKEISIPVYVGMRNWHPYIADTIKKMIADGVTQMASICLAPQNSRTSVGLYHRAALEAAGDKLKIEFVESWYNHPLLIAAFAANLGSTWQNACDEAGAKVPVIFTAHSVPCGTVESSENSPADPYADQARETAALVAAMIAGLSVSDWRFAFQSQGMSGGPWIGPTVEETIQELHHLGHGTVLIQTIGFVCDHVEVLYDIDIAFRKFAAELGMKLWRADSLNASPEFITALADLARTCLSRL